MYEGGRGAPCNLKIIRKTMVMGNLSFVAISQTSNSLPKTSYFKLVDVWLFFSIVMIFNVVMLQTLVDFSQQSLLGKKSRLSMALVG